MSFRSELVGSFSTGSAENPTVAMMDAAFAAEGLDWRYVNCEVEPDDLPDAVAGARAMGWRGFNCSVPHKQAVIEHLDELSPTAAITAAVNCIVRTPAGWVGHNTDGVGFATAAEEHLELGGCRMLIVGAGGAAHAIGVEVALRGAATVLVANRTAARAEALASLIAERTPARAEVWAWPGAPSTPVGLPEDTDLVVQATPVGMAPHTGAAVPVAWDGLRPGTVVADVVPNPPRTRFLDEASARGAAVVDGTGMLVNQAAENIRLWTDRVVDRAVLRAALERAFAGA
ncbi:MAG: shikimate dehydrogenase [Acidimicrobiia bacterium]|nr:shikimate dehydrogenase [Acidimicrobiia bacterium]